MARGVVAVLAVLAIGAVAAYLLVGQDAGPLSELDRPADAGSAPEQDVAPGLAAPRRAAASLPVAGPDAWHVEVLVLDAAGEPAAGSVVSLRSVPPSAELAFRNPGLRQQAMAWAATSLRRALHERGRGGWDKPRSEAVTDTDGRARLDGSGNGQLALEARSADGTAHAHAMFHVVDGRRPALLTLRLDALVQVAVRVLDAGGRGLVARLAPSLVSEGAVAWRGEPAMTDAEGALTLAVPRGKLQLTVAAGPQLALEAGPYDVPRDEAIEVRLPALEAQLDVHVHDGAGEPVGGAVVAVRLAETGRTLLCAETSDAGTARLEVPAGELELVQVEARGFLSRSETAPLARWAPTRLARDAPARIEVSLDAAATIHGVVRRGEGGPGVSEATVHLLLSNLAAAEGTAAWPTVESDAQGAYRLEGVPPGRHALYVTHDTYVHTAVEASRAAPELPDEVIAFVPGGGARIERDLVLDPGAVVRGVVVDEAGASVGDATILVVPAEGWGASQAWNWGVRVPLAWRADVTTTDGAGAFWLVWMPGPAIRLGATCAEGVAPFSEPIPLVAGATVDDVRLVVAGGVTVRGVVLDEASRSPVVGARVEAWSGPLPDRPAARARATSDADGRFELRGLPRAKLTLVARRGGNGSATARRVLDLHEEGTEADGVELLFATGHTVVLALVDETAAPIRGQWVFVEGNGSAQHAMSDARGEVELAGLAAGRYTLWVQAADRPRVRLEPALDVPAVGPVVRVVSRALARVVEGRVLLPDGSSPALCTVRLGAPPGSRAVAHGGPVQVTGGTFRMSVEGAPPYVAKVTAVFDATGQALDVRAPEAPITEEHLARGPLEIRLERAHALRLRVVDEAGQPVAGATVWRSGGGSSVVTDAEGRAQIAGLAAGVTLRVGVRAAGFRELVDVELRVDPDREIEIRLARGSTVRGRVVYGTLGFADAHVMAQWRVPGQPAPRMTTTKPDAEGRFELAGLPDQGTVSLSLGWISTGASSVRRARPPTQDVPVGATDVVFDASGSLPLAGRVLDETGQPLAQASVQARDAHDAVAEVRTDEAGRFELTGLAPGTVRLTATQPRGQRHSIRVEASAGSRDVEVRFRPSGTIRGRLTGGEPPYERYFTLLLASDGAGMPSTGAVAEDGTFSLLTQEGITYDLWVLGQGVEHFGRVEGLVGGGRDLAVALAPGGSLAGRVEGLGPELLAASKLRVSAQSTARAWIAAIVAEDGTWRLTGMPPGTYRLDVSGLPTGTMLVSGYGEVEPGSPDVVLRVEAGGGR